MRSLSLKLGLIFLLLNLILCADQSKKSKRTLAEEEDSIKVRVCKKADTDYTMNNTFTTLTDFVDSISKAEPNAFLKGVISSGGKDIATGLVDFLLSMLAYVIMMVFGLITLIVWPILWCLCCCKCCCFNKKKKTGLAAYIHYGISIGLFTGILISSIIGLSNSTKFVQYFNGSSCYLLTFFDHIIDGDEKEILPRWAGINEIDKTLTNTNTAILGVGTESNNIFATYATDITTPKSTYTTKIDDLYGATPPTKPSTPNGSNSPSLPFQQLCQKSNSLIEKMKIEEQTTVTAAVTALESIKTSSLAMNSQTGDITSSLNTVKSSLNDFGGLASELSSDIGSSFVEIQDQYTEYIVIGFQVLFGILIGISSLVIVTLSLYVWLKIYWLKIVVHVLWNFTMLLTILSFLIGGVLGLLGHLGKEVVPVVGYLFSEGLSSFGSGGGQATDLIGTCLNGNGDLAATLGITGSSDPTRTLEGLYNSSIAIKNVKDQLAPITPSNTECKQALDKVSNWIDDIPSVYNPDLFNPALIEAKNECNNKDVVIASSCPGGVGSCFLIDKTSSSHTSESGVTADCNTMLAAIQKSAYENYDLLTDKKTDLNGINLILDPLITKIKTKVDDSYDMTSDLIAALDPVIGTNNSFYSMLNCGFIKDDIIIFLDQFGNVFANSSQAIGITLIASSFFGFVGVFFFIASMNYFTADARGDNKKDKKDDSISKKDKKEHDRDSSRNFNEKQDVDNNANKPLEPSLVKYSKVDVKEDI